MASSGTLSVGATGAVWTGDVPAGATVTITGSLIVADPYPAGSQVISLTAVTTAAGSNCPAGSTDPACTPVANVVIPALSIVETASTTAAVPGQTVSYTLTVTNTGQTPYTGAAVTAFAQTCWTTRLRRRRGRHQPAPSAYTSPVLTWTGDLAAGASAVITYTVTVNNPDTGDKNWSSPSPPRPSRVAPARPAPPPARCQLTVPVLTPALTITAAAAPATATPGATVSYTLTVTDTGQTPYTGATFTDPLTGVLDDAAYTGDASATAGTVTYTAPDLSWTGDLNPGDTAIITFSVTVDNPDTGDHLLASTLTSATAGSNCPAGSTDPRCTATVPVSDLVIDFAVSASTVTPGGTLVYTATFTNTGQTPYFGISVSTGTVALAANVTSDGNVTASSGTLFDRGDRNGLDRGHPHRRHRHHHLPRHGRQPRHQRHADRHRRIGRTRQQLPGRVHRPPLHPHHPDPDPRPDHHQDRLGEHHHARLDGELHHHRHRHRPHPLHRRHHHRPARRRPERRDLRQRRGRRPAAPSATPARS